ncbi:MAG: hypothetical protein RR486_06895 [Clostridium sp.]
MLISIGILLDVLQGDYITNGKEVTIVMISFLEMLTTKVVYFVKGCYK